MVHPVLHQLTQFSNVAAWGARGCFGTNLVGSLDRGNCAVSVWVTPIDDDDFGIIFRYADEGNCYRLHANADFEKFWALVKIVDGRQQIFKELRSKCYIPGRSYLVEMAAYENRIHVYVNGKLLMRAQDATHRSGRIGLFCMCQSGVMFDDLVVYANDSGQANEQMSN